ncbi:MAG TPA: RES family NAD+ phosphorylase [Streptosporangiaceae bacterium]|nr:RES family NAD+ phosphorylase [Streptosporangiaceae bacterium]
MGASAPPSRYDGSPNRFVLRRGTCLWRVHASKRSASAFNPTTVSMLYGGGRFDATAEDTYPFFYAGLDEETALSEALLRDVAHDERGKRLIPRAVVADRSFAGVILTRDLTLISLMTGADLGAVGQDAWLINATKSEYAQTRGWAHWLRTQAGWAQGIAWPSLRNTGGTAVILFGDRCAMSFGPDYGHGLLHAVPSLSINLDDRFGIEWLNERLGQFNSGIAPP